MTTFTNDIKITTELELRDLRIHHQDDLIAALTKEIKAYADHDIEGDTSGQGSDRRNSEYGAYVGRTKLANDLDYILKKFEVVEYGE